jgi:hypothetical protein
MVSRRTVEELAIVVFSGLIASTTAYIIDLYPQESLAVTEILLGITIALFLLLILYRPLSDLIWTISIKWKLLHPVIGIIKQPGCQAMYTSFTPQDWKDAFDRLSLHCEFITVSEINDRFVAIINPYGEVYPEEELLTLKTFERVKKYISDGGIFHTAGGLAFFYGGDIRSPSRNVALADELQVFIPLPPPLPAGALQPQNTYPPMYSLTSTLLQKNFGAVTTWRDTERSRCFQRGEDRRFVGDIANQGGIDEVLHFRAIREPLRRCLPFLRVQPANWQGDVYVIAGIPYGKGCLILNGFDLRDNTQYTNPQWSATIHRANFEKICYALKNLLNNRHIGSIPLSTEDW